MDAAKLIEGSLVDAATALEQSTTTSTELTEACLGRLEDRRELNAFLATNPAALDAARASDSRRRAGATRGPLDGIPVAVKDNLVTEGLATTAGSKMLEHWSPPYTAFTVERLQAAGAVILGKTNLDEFSMGSSNEHSAFGRTKHPEFEERVPGGSSGGSAAATAAQIAFAALGSDTGGSIRQPASFCGVLGLKPTYGRVSRYGLVAFASSLDQVGTFARSAPDLAAVTQAIAGFDARDATSIDIAVPDWSAALSSPLKGLRVGRVRQYFEAATEEAVASCCEASLKRLEGHGAEIVDVDLNTAPYALPAYYVIAPAEASSNLSRYDGVRYGFRAEANSLDELYARSRFQGFGPEVRTRIALGTFVLSAGYRDAYYTRAQQVRTLVTQDFEQAFGQVDLLVGPTTPTTAFEAGSCTGDPLEMYRADVLTVAANLAGIPAASVPAGTNAQGLPVGVQLMAPWWQESRIFAAAAALESD